MGQLSPELRLEQGIEEHGDKDMAATYLTSAPSSGVSQP
jgi:hypothetical protein